MRVLQRSYSEHRQNVNADNRAPSYHNHMTQIPRDMTQLQRDMTQIPRPPPPALYPSDTAGSRQHLADMVCTRTKCRSSVRPSVCLSLLLCMS